MLRFSPFLLAAICLTACGTIAQPTRDAAGAPNAVPAAPKSLVVGISLEPKGFGGMYEGGPAGPEHLQAMIQRDLVDPNDQGVFRPEVAAELPSRDKGTWQVFPDGRMDTTWVIRPGVRWHDGTPLTVDDVIFSWQVALAPDVPYKQRVVPKLIDDIQAIDARTFVVHWKSLYWGGGLLRTRDFFLLPKHILEPTFNADRAAFVNSRFWSFEFVGLGPYKLVHWEPGAFAQLEAFDGFYGSAPHIQNITVRFITDSNQEVASILAGQTDVQTPGILSVQHALLLKSQWESRGAGRVVTAPHGIAHVRFAPGDPRTTDVRVRKALYQGIDRQGLVDSLYSGLIQVAHSWINPNSTEFRVVDAQITKYPYDPSKAAQAMADLGWRLGSDGQLHNDHGAAYDLPFSTTSGNPEKEQLQTAIAAMWTRLGFNVQIENAAPSVAASPTYQFLATDLTGIGADFESNITRIDGRELRTPQNPGGAGILGENNPAVDRLLDQWRQNLDGTAAVNIEAQVMHLVSEDLVTLPISYNIDVETIAAGVTGVPEMRVEAPANNSAWNVELWDRG